MNENGEKNYRTLRMPLRKSVEEANIYTHTEWHIKIKQQYFSEHKLCHTKYQTIRLFILVHKKKMELKSVRSFTVRSRFNCFIYGCHLAEDKNQLEHTHFEDIARFAALFNVF